MSDAILRRSALLLALIAALSVTGVSPVLSNFHLRATLLMTVDKSVFLLNNILNSW
jgi:hypothetical protein